MAFRTKKISQMDPKGAPLASTDLLEISELVSGSYVTKSITGAEIIDSIPLPPTGITIGTTAITSGTVGRVLFEGTGNVVQESANLVFDNGRLGIGTSSPAHPIDVRGLNEIIKVTATGGGSTIKYQNSFGSTWNAGSTGNDFYWLYNGVSSFMTLKNNGNVLINTTTDAGFRLDVNGPARVSGNLTVATGFEFVFNNQNVGLYRSANNLRLGGFGGIEFLSSETTIASQTIRMTLKNSGNLLINTTTDAGFKLDVLGATRVGLITPTEANAGFIASSANHFFYIKSISSTSGEIGFRRGNSSGLEDGDYKFLFDNASAFINYNRPNQVLSTSCQFHLSYVTAGSERGRWTNTGNYLINTTTDAGFKLDVNGTARVVNNFTVGNVIQNGGNANTFASIINHMGAAQSVTGFNTTRINANTDLGVGFAGAPDVSAVVELRGTTKGFLPPRMTTTQKNAIATPATGLMVYDTTLNLISVYNGTTWITL